MPQDLKYKGEPTKLVIGNKNAIRESCTLNIGTDGGGGVTRQVGDESILMMAYVHLGYDTSGREATPVICQWPARSRGM